MQMNEIINKALEGKEYIVGDSFTLADLHVSSGAAVSFMFGLDLSALPNLSKWLQKIMSRPSAQKLQAQAQHAAH